VLDLALVQQQLAGAPRRMVGPRAVAELRNVQAAQPDLAVVDGREGKASLVDALPSRKLLTSVPTSAIPAS